LELSRNKKIYFAYLLFFRVLVKVKEKFDPEVVVCQCGADGLAGDPNESFNLTPLSLGKCVYTLKSWKLPILLLGGGKITFMSVCLRNTLYQIVSTYYF
jgi:acetoin utilization deacetylase AcuC-like enzyme